MANGVNKVILIGNLGKDPEVKYFEGGRGFAKFPIATTESYKDKNGDRQDQTEWHNIAVWRPGLVGIVEKYVKKGDKIYVEGKLRTRSWEDETKNMRYITEIVVDSLTLLGGAPNSSSPDAKTPYNNEPQKKTEQAPINEPSAEEEDDLPF